jgi:hypothetical protein
MGLDLAYHVLIDWFTISNNRLFCKHFFGRERSPPFRDHESARPAEAGNRIGLVRSYHNGSPLHRLKGLA